jgi:biopolymer transport protein ExbD
VKKKHNRIRLPEAAVNITSLMDVLVVLLFFFITSFSMDASKVFPPEDIRLPASVSTQEPEESVVVSLSQNYLKVGDKTLIELKKGNYPVKAIADDKRSLAPLMKYLEKQMSKRRDLFKSGAAGLVALPPGKILIQADKEVPFKNLKYLLYTASVTGYTDYQFVVVPK